MTMLGTITSSEYRSFYGLKLLSRFCI